MAPAGSRLWAPQRAYHEKTTCTRPEVYRLCRGDAAPARSRADSDK